MQSAATLILATAVFSQFNPAAAKLQDNRKTFKQQMMPYVGTVVTVTGQLAVGKISDFVWTDDPGAVYVRATKTADVKKEDELSRQMTGKRIAVTGKLQFAEEVVPRNPDGSVRTDVTRISEHFYIDIADATIRAAGYER
jgi:hypothetical protein